MPRPDDSDEWGPWPIALGPDKVATIRAALEKSALIVEHRHYRGGKSPDHLLFYDFESLEEYLRVQTRPGDSIWCWRLEDLLRDDNALTWGKIPDQAGEVPKRGAY
jgi:hypothetical protein